MLVRPVAAAFLSLVLLSAPSSPGAESPYKGQEKGPVKALTEKEVEDLLAGNGMGLAKAAELNRYPGPLHVLELAPRLGLTEAQRTETQRLYDAVKREAVPLGREIVERERALDARFAAQEVEEASLAAALAEIARLSGALRHVHLKAHLRMREVLTPHQNSLYARLRGYESPQGTGGHSGH